MFDRIKSIYPKELDNHIRFNTKYIPRLIEPKEELVLYHRYWIKDLNTTFKLSKIEEYFRVKYYYLESKDTSQLYTHPLNDNQFYEMVINTTDILQEDIINNSTKYKGYEIKYWFFKKWSKKKHEDYTKYLSMDSQFVIDDNKSYIVQGVLIKNKYHNCKIIIDS